MMAESVSSFMVTSRESITSSSSVGSGLTSRSNELIEGLGSLVKDNIEFLESESSNSTFNFALMYMAHSWLKM